jgi:hypothetical protein
MAYSANTVGHTASAMKRPKDLFMDDLGRMDEFGSGDCSKVFTNAKLELIKCQSILNQETSLQSNARNKVQRDVNLGHKGSMELYAFTFKILASLTGFLLSFTLKKNQCIHAWIGAGITQLFEQLAGDADILQTQSSNSIFNKIRSHTVAQVLQLLILVFLYILSFVLLSAMKILLFEVPACFWK